MRTVPPPVPLPRLRRFFPSFPAPLTRRSGAARRRRLAPLRRLRQRGDRGRSAHRRLLPIEQDSAKPAARRAPPGRPRAATGDDFAEHKRSSFWPAASSVSLGESASHSLRIHTRREHRSRCDFVTIRSERCSPLRASFALHRARGASFLFLARSLRLVLPSNLTARVVCASRRTGTCARHTDKGVIIALADS